MYQTTVLSEGDGYRLLGELQQDGIVPKNTQAQFDTHVGYSLDCDGNIVMDTEMITIMRVEEVTNVKRRKSRKTTAV